MNIQWRFPAGFHCEDWGLFEPSGPCQAGYYCTAGMLRKTCPCSWGLSKDIYFFSLKNVDAND